VTAAVAGGSQLLWFLSRGSGLILLVVLSVVVALGVATRMGSKVGRLPRFAVPELHRTLSLFGVSLLLLHVATAIADPYVSIGWLAAVVPFVAHYRPAVLGLGTLAVDLLGAVVVTSLLRQRLGYRFWRAVHWVGYAAWPIALVHALRAGPDGTLWWAALIEWTSVGLVATAVVARALDQLRPLGRRGPVRRDPVSL
jgi:sulfoxide reductase heme-binding subunit YedZ